MKRIGILAILLSFFACGEGVTSPDKLAVVDTIYNSPIPSDTLNRILYLFEDHNIPYDDYKHLSFFRYILDKRDGDTITESAICRQYVNGLKVLPNALTYRFRKDKFYAESDSALLMFYAPKLIYGMKYDIIPLSNEAQIDEEYIKQRYVNRVISSGDENMHKEGYVTVENVVAELCYYVHRDSSITRMWDVHFKDSDYPIFQISDIDTTVRYYFNGLIIN